jgi:hypothetical protein
MKIILSACAVLLFVACRQDHRSAPVIVSLHYRQADIQHQFDTLYNYQQTTDSVYTGLTEQALAPCHGRPDSITQDVFSSMYLNRYTGKYDCTTTTTFQFPDGIITAVGVFNLTPGSGIAPDHDFPITGGAGAYAGITGTYTRKYRDSVYHVELRYRTSQ